MPTAQRQRLPLDAQLAKLERILADRVQFYKLGVRKGRLATDVGAEKHAECQDIYRSFRRYVRNAAWIEPEINRRTALAAQAAEADTLRDEFEQHPAVAAVREHFPGAAIADVRPLAAAASEDFSEQESTP